MSGSMIMSLGQALGMIPVFVLVFFRIAGMMLFAPLFGSAKIPRRVKIMISLVLAFAMTGSINVRSVQLPETLWGMTIGIGSELMFGLVMGTVVSFVFIAAQWGGEMVGTQMGLNISEVIDPQFGQQSALISNFYFMLCMAVFLSPGVSGHHALIRGVRASFDYIPLMTATINHSIISLMAGLFMSAAQLAIQLAAPMLMTMLIVDLTLGCIGRAMPQMNVMAMGLSLKSLIGIGVLVLGISLTATVLMNENLKSANLASSLWTTKPNTVEP